MIKIILNKLLSIALTVLVFIYIIFEELVWETIAKPIYDYLHSLKILKKLEIIISKMHRVALLVLFLIMFIKVELLGIFAAVMLAQGKVYTAVMMYAGKIPVGAFTFWLFRVSKDKLMTFGWFKTAYDYVMSIIDKIKDSDIYKSIKKTTAELKVYIKKLKVKYFGEKSHLKDHISKIYSSIKSIFKN